MRTTSGTAVSDTRQNLSKPRMCVCVSRREMLHGVPCLSLLDLSADPQYRKVHVIGDTLPCSSPAVFIALAGGAHCNIILSTTAPPHGMNHPTSFSQSATPPDPWGKVHKRTRGIGLCCCRYTPGVRPSPWRSAKSRFRPPPPSKAGTRLPHAFCLLTFCRGRFWRKGLCLCI